MSMCDFVFNGFGVVVDGLYCEGRECEIVRCERKIAVGKPEQTFALQFLPSELTIVPQLIPFSLHPFQ